MAHDHIKICTLCLIEATERCLHVAPIRQPSKENTVFCCSCIRHIASVCMGQLATTSLSGASKLTIYLIALGAADLQIHAAKQTTRIGARAGHRERMAAPRT